MSPFGASAHTLLTLGVEWAGGFVFKAWEEHKERMAAARRSGLEEGLERGREEGREEGRAEMREEYERRLARVPAGGDGEDRTGLGCAAERERWGHGAVP